MSQHCQEQFHIHQKLERKQLYNHFVVIIWGLWGKSLFILLQERWT